MGVNLTPWFPSDMKPARVGLYLTRIDGTAHQGVFRHWDGQFWSFMDNFTEPNMLLDLPREWRGLVKDLK